MTSKEALKELIENAQDMCEWELIRLNIVKKDLDRLEKLERENKHFREMRRYKCQLRNNLKTK